MKTARYIDIKVFNEGHKTSKMYRIDAGAGNRVTAEGARESAEQFVFLLQQKAPHLRLQLVPLSFNRFNIVHNSGRA